MYHNIWLCIYLSIMFSESTRVLENIKLLLENMKELHGIAENQRLLDVNGLGDRSVCSSLNF